MKVKLLFWCATFLLLIPIAFAQTGLFSSEGAGSFASTGITFVVLFFIARTIFKDLLRRMKKK